MRRSFKRFFFQVFRKKKNYITDYVNISHLYQTPFTVVQTDQFGYVLFHLQHFKIFDLTSFKFTVETGNSMLHYKQISSISIRLGDKSMFDGAVLSCLLSDKKGIQNILTESKNSLTIRFRGKRREV